MPQTLAELVPDFLPAVPVDPFEPDGGPIRYRPNGVIAKWNNLPTTPVPIGAKPALRIIVYSVGPNQIDDHGDFMLDQDGIATDIQYAREYGDIVFIIRKLSKSPR